MKNKHFNLALFAECNSSTGDGSESTLQATEGNSDSSALDRTDNTNPTQTDNEKPEENAEHLNDTEESISNNSEELSDALKIAAALGIEGETTEDILSRINSEKLKNDFYDMLRRKSADYHFQNLLSEAESFASQCTGFNLEREMANPRFASLIKCGFSVTEAYRATYFDRILDAAVSRAKKEGEAYALEKFKANSSRPDENGTFGSSPVSSSQDVKSLTGKGIRDILRRVENGAKVKF